MQETQEEQSDGKSSENVQRFQPECLQASSVRILVLDVMCSCPVQQLSDALCHFHRRLTPVCV